MELSILVNLKMGRLKGEVFLLQKMDLFMMGNGKKERKMAKVFSHL